LTRLNIGAETEADFVIINLPDVSRPQANRQNVEQKMGAWTIFGIITGKTSDSGNKRPFFIAEEPLGSWGKPLFFPPAVEKLSIDFRF
jgi:hypothetical protein